MKKVIGIIAVVLAVCAISACKPDITKSVGNKTIQAVEWTYSKAKSGANWCVKKIGNNIKKMDLKKSTKQCILSLSKPLV